MWAYFKSVAQQILIQDQLAAKREGAFQTYETYYSDMIGKEAYDKLAKERGKIQPDLQMKA